MVDKFEVGEIAIIYSLGDSWHGEEVEIMSSIGHQEGAAGNGKVYFSHAAYEVRFLSGHLGYAEPKNLRKKKPPRKNQDIEDAKENPDKLMSYDDLIMALKSGYEQQLTSA